MSQVGQLWMLAEGTLRKECKRFNLSTEGSKVDLITRLGQCIRAREKKMLTMESGVGGQGPGRFDVTPINKVDDEDLPKNMGTRDREELQCVAASYGVSFDHGKDVKQGLGFFGN